LFPVPILKKDSRSQRWQLDGHEVEGDTPQSYAHQDATSNTHVDHTTSQYGHCMFVHAVHHDLGGDGHIQQ
jgi:hypothetical protein